MKKRYIFATDVDGTLLMDNHEVHPETLEALKRAKEEGHVIVIATGRAVVGTSDIQKKMPYASYLVCNNGAIVYDVENKDAFILHAVNPQHYPIVVDFAREYNLTFKMHTNVDYVGWENRDGRPMTVLTDELDNKIREHIKNNPKDKKLFNGQTITQLSIFAPESDFCAKFYPKFQKMFSHDSSIFLTNSVFLDVNPHGTSKWTGLLELAKKLNIPSNQIITFGDSGNDYEMLKGAGEHGYAMANSHKDLVEKIKPRIDSNNTGAIGQKINEYLNK